jgi:hypothetical protein
VSDVLHITPGGTRPSGSRERVMRCARCDGEWKTPAARPLAPVACPFCNVHVCGCGCGADLSELRRGAIYHSESHSKALARAASPDVAPIRSVAEARAIQEDAKGYWSAIVREGIIAVLRETGYFHADDLGHLGIPDEHRNIIGSQTAKLVNQKWMVKRGERKSVNPSRNAAKTGIYQATAFGLEGIAGAGAGTLPTCVDSGDHSSAGVPTPQGPKEAADAPCSASAGAPEPLFEVPAPAPLNPLADSEAA